MKKKIKDIWYKTSLRSKLIIFSAAIIFITSGFVAYSMYMYGRTLRRYSEYINDYYMINQLIVEVNANDNHISKLMRTGDDEDLTIYETSKEKIRDLLATVEEKVESKETWVEIKAIRVSIDQMQEDYESAITAQKNGSQQYYLIYYKGSTIHNYVKTYLGQFLNVTLSEGVWTYNNKVLPFTKRMQIVLLAIFLVTSIASIAFAVVFSDHISKPIRRIAVASNKIAQGDFRVPDITTEHHDEIGIMADSFNQMRANLEEMVNSLKQKSIIERNLAEEKLKNIEFQQTLRESELMALQSQINPHFLFNTMNSIAATASLEGAEGTRQLILALSKGLRYQIGRPSRVVTLSTELQMLENYLYIEKYRFGERLQVEVNCSIDADEYYVPAFILQPLAENAIIHGISPNEKAGLLKIDISEEEETITIRIADNGVGMEQEKIDSILKGVDNSNSSIGISNVVKRIDRFFEGKADFSIYSRVGEGTEAVLRLPARKNPMSDV
ncbi:MAG: sensor histidine kinase [Lachnospiraceae bacterium]|nr:sensor histidine kinase [Lachnospiraceae bacterium]